MGIANSDVKELLPEIVGAETAKQSPYSRRKFHRPPPSGNDDARVGSPSLRPLAMQAFEIDSVVGEQNPACQGGRRELLSVRSPEAPDIPSVTASNPAPAIRRPPPRTHPHPDGVARQT